MLTSTDMCHLEALPVELLERIFLILDTKSALNLAICSKNLNSILNNSLKCWRNICRDQHLDTHEWTGNIKVVTTSQWRKIYQGAVKVNKGLTSKDQKVSRVLADFGPLSGSTAGDSFDPEKHQTLLHLPEDTKSHILFYKSINHPSRKLASEEDFKTKVQLFITRF